MITGIKDQLNIDWKEIVKNLKVIVPDGFIEKPIDPDKLKNLVDEVLADTEHSQLHIAE